jgi:hypothetical protein
VLRSHGIPGLQCGNVSGERDKRATGKKGKEECPELSNTRKRRLSQSLDVCEEEEEEEEEEWEEWKIESFQTPFA